MSSTFNGVSYVDARKQDVLPGSFPKWPDSLYNYVLKDRTANLNNIGNRLYTNNGYTSTQNLPGFKELLDDKNYNGLFNTGGIADGLKDNVDFMFSMECICYDNGSGCIATPTLCGPIDPNQRQSLINAFGTWNSPAYKVYFLKFCEEFAGNHLNIKKFCNIQ